MAKRKAISKKLRFEVFKRDNFTCQYCGKSAPDVILEVDHIKSVKEGGTNDITNLITSCRDCNRGKGKRLLDDKTMLKKQQKQLEELNERREQMEMMMKWREELLKLEDENVEYVNQYFEQLTTHVLTENGKLYIRKLIKEFGVEEVLKSLEISATQYLEINNDGKYEPNSISKTVDSIGGICRNRKLSKEKPYLPKLYYIKGILRNRLNYYDNRKIIRLLEDAYLAGASLDSLEDLATEVKYWNEFCEEIYRFINERKGNKEE